jgi:hypothetical protein
MAGKRIADGGGPEISHLCSDPNAQDAGYNLWRCSLDRDPQLGKHFRHTMRLDCFCSVPCRE